MVGITRIGTYFPRRRLDRALIAKAWGTRVPAGTRTVAGLDEDALTMATDAVLACLGDADPAAFDALYFASTSSPYLEKQVASMIATAADLRRDAVVADLAGSVRAGVAALRAALDGVRAGSLRTALVAAADARLAEPESELEPLLGDGAASVAVGSEGVVAELVSAASVAEEFTYVWRTDEQRTLRVSETRFGTSHGYVRAMAEGVAAALRKAELPPACVARLVLGAPEPRAAAEAARRAGLDPARQLEASLVAEAGLLGTPEPLALLARPLETAAPGDFLAVGAYGEGADARVLRATERLPAARPRPLADRLAHGIALPSYERYLRARGVLPSEPMGEPVTAMIEWKELKQDMRLYGSRCEACGLVQYPQARVCIGCQARDRMQDHKLGKRGSVFTFTNDNLAPVPEHPMPMAVIGVGCTKFGDRYERSFEDLICDAAFEAYADAGIEPDEIEAAYLGTYLPGPGGGKAAVSLADALRLYDRPITRVENYCATGTDAFRNGCLAVAAGAHDVVLVLGAEKLKDRGGRGIPRLGHPLLARGNTAPGLFALAANRYMHTFGLGRETLAKVAVKNHRNGARNEKAHLRIEVTEEQVLKAPIIAWPFGLLDCCPTTDGAAAAIICRADLAKRFKHSPVLVKGAGLAVATGRPYFDPTFDYLGFRSTQAAARQAYAAAGITARDLDFAEVHDCFTWTEISNIEDLGFCTKGEGGKLVEEGRTALEGDIPVNPSGGLKSFGHPIGASGVRMIYECVTQLRGEAGSRQAKDPELGLAHNVGGPGAVSCVIVLGRS